MKLFNKGSTSGETVTEAEVVVEPSEFPRKGGHGNGTEEWYSVEARYMFNEPKQFGSQLFDQRWKRVKFDTTPLPVGVPSGPPSLSGLRDKLGLYSYQAAQALRWWFHANAAASWNDLCLETRLVKHRVKYSYECEAISAHAVIGGDDRSNVMPDWGKKNG